LVEDGKDYWAVAWMCVRNNEGVTSYTHSSSFLLPPKVSKLIQEGIELGHATDQVFLTSNSKHKQGAIGVLTDNNIDRHAYYIPAMISALIPFAKPELYSGE
jgi:non-canonical (house-cleaning) NTP pyrophosphatase